MRLPIALRCLLAACALVLGSCSTGPVKRVSAPTTSIQQLTVRTDGSWAIELRLQNYSSIPMRFDRLSLQLTVDEQAAGSVQASPAITIGPESADVVTTTLAPSGAARLVVADALAAGRPMAYRLQGQVTAIPEDKKARDFDLDSRNTLNPAPGLDGVLR